MRIGIDIGPIRTARSGVGTYCHCLVRHLLAGAPHHEFVGFSSGLSRPDTSGLSIKARHIGIPTRALYAAWEMLGTPKVDALLGGVDVYHATNYFLPPVRSARRVLSIHDLVFLAHPELSSPKIRGLFADKMRKFAHGADRILTCSQATRRDIVELLEVDPAKIHVSHYAADEAIVPMNREEAAHILSTAYGIQSPFILFVGTIEPRKNLPTLVRAFARLVRDIPHTLVLVGAPGWGMKDFQRTIDMHHLGDRVKQVGFVPEHADLSAFYAAADVFVFPSFYEGFGLPLIEAMTCGCPVITTDTSALPEVAGTAALYVKPTDVDGMAATIRMVLSNDRVRNSLIERGTERAKHFSWDACVGGALAVYEELAQK